MAGRLCAARGLGPLPKLADLSSEGLQITGFVLFRLATVGMAVALFRGHAGELRLATTFFAVSLLPFAIHVAFVVSHLKKPRAFAAPAGTRYAAAH